jgi:hypothetical protein
VAARRLLTLVAPVVTGLGVSGLARNGEAGPIWREAMSEALEDEPGEDFAEP